MAFALRDDMGRQCLFPHPPQRVVSLVPSDTDTLFRLGVGDRVVGRTTFCVESAAVAALPTCGGTKDVDVDAVLALAPDLVLANQEENSRSALESLAQRGARVFVSFPQRVADGIAQVARLARIFGVERTPEAVELIKRGYEVLRDPPAPRVRVFVPIWNEPWMTMSAETFGSDILALAGASNVFADRKRRYPLAADLGLRSPLAADRIATRDLRYPRITVDEIVERGPELVLLPDEPYAFGDEHAAWFRSLAIPAAERDGGVRLVDGKDLFWHGARSIEALPRLRALISGAS